ncbi:MAG TPA: putative cytokinetic ring protein SteA [Segeticoccus sp.]|nr:putative cytokinetic ring protein SteA [Segeticoccus sp.]
MRVRGRRAVLDATRHPPVVVGRLVAGRTTKRLVRCLRPGDVAVIDHADVDALSADALVEAGVAAVVNLAPSLTGRYPATGARRLLAAGVPVLDVPDGAADALRHHLDPGQDRPDHPLARLEGERLTVDGDVAVGRLLTAQALEAGLAAARARAGTELEGFARNTLRFLHEEQDLLVAPLDLPPLRTRVGGRPVLVVVRGPGHRADLAALSWFVRERDPVLLGVDGGADALLEAGHRPDLVVGDMDSVSDTALAAAGEVVVHAYRTGEAPGRDRVRALGLPDPLLFPMTGTSEDAALLLAHGLGASLLVAVGSRTSLDEFLDKGRAGMASTFLTRLRVGDRLVDAKGLSWLSQPGPP